MKHVAICKSDQVSKSLVKTVMIITHLDATYKTTKYLLLLFFMILETNVNYQVIALFVIEDEITTAITDALRIIKD